MPYEPQPRAGATRWTTILGLCLALVAAGSFIAFSLVAREAAAPVDPPIAAVSPASSSPVITLAQPGTPRAEERVTRARNGVDLVLEERFDEGPVTVVVGGTPAEDRTTSDSCRRCSTKAPGLVADSDDDPVATPTRKARKADDSGYEAKGNGARGRPRPSPRGKAKGHYKSHGKGRGKHH